MSYPETTTMATASAFNLPTMENNYFCMFSLLFPIF